MITVLPRHSSWRRIWWTHPELSLAAVAAAAWLTVLTLHAATGPLPIAAQQLSTRRPDHGMAGHHHGRFNPGIAGHQSLMSGPGWTPTFLVSVALWVLMATAMMLPTALPEARSISLNGKWKRRQRGPALFAIGYLAMWSAVGVLLLSAAWLVGAKATSPLAISGALALAAAWESTRWKRLCLRACHRLQSLPPDGWRADRASVREGIRNGVYCTGSCGPMMVSMALAPHSVGLSLMLFLFAVVSLEKLLTSAVNHLRLVAATLAVAAVIVVSGAAVIS
jgi:predicted metal-binding membrane protein